MNKIYKFWFLHRPSPHLIIHLIGICKVLSTKFVIITNIILNDDFLMSRLDFWCVTGN